MRRAPRSGVGAVLVVLAAAVACSPPSDPAPGRDPHSYARPDEVRVDRLELDLTVRFDERRLVGRATLRIENLSGARELWLDSRDLDVRAVRLGSDERETTFRFGEGVEYLGRPLVIDVEPDTREVHVDYATSPGAIALQWLGAEQTAGGRQPFLLTQSQSVYARTWIPCQDSPGVRVSYDATIRVPPGLTALMSAENPTAPAPDGVYTFRMPQAIPSYLMALAVGELEFRSLGARSGVYAEPEVIESAAWEFAETEKMIEVAERLYGPYRWGRFDMIVLPPSFPFGGMENPRLSFITPTLIAGDRSLVGTVAHELAHSWSGNLVTNATWGDFWLNEGFTSYLEKRIMEELYGRDYTEMLAVLDGGDLYALLDELGDSPDAHLRLDLAGRDPEEAPFDVAYEKGYLFLRMLEERLGREEWDSFLRAYFDEFAFRSVTSSTFLDYLRAQAVAPHPDAAALERELRLDDWVDGPGLPPNAPRPASPAFEQVETAAEDWLAGRPAAELETDGFTVHHTTHFLRALPDSLDPGRLAELDAALGLTGSGNAAVQQAWLEVTIDHRYAPADAALEEFLVRVGRRWLIQSLYEKLVATDEGLERARRIYQKARPGYHPITQGTIDGILEAAGGK